MLAGLSFKLPRGKELGAPGQDGMGSGFSLSVAPFARLAPFVWTDTVHDLASAGGPAAQRCASGGLGGIWIEKAIMRALGRL